VLDELALPAVDPTGEKQEEQPGGPGAHDRHSTVSETAVRDGGSAELAADKVRRS